MSSFGNIWGGCSGNGCKWGSYSSLVLNLAYPLNIEASHKFLPFHVFCAGIFSITSLLRVTKSMFEYLL